MEKLLAKAFLNALDEIAKLRGKDFDYFETACELMDGFTNSEVLNFLDKYGMEDDSEDSVRCAKYDADHAAEWMERHPYGYYNNESDYGTGDEDE